MQIYSQKTSHYNVSENDSTTIEPVPLERNPSCIIQRTRKHFLKYFLDFGYYLCVIPYKIVESADGTYVKKKFIIQQGICCILQIIAILDVTSYLRGYDYSKVSLNPKMYFEIFISMVHTVVIIAFCHLTWKRVDLLCSLLQKVQKCPIVSTWYPKRVTHIMLALIIINTLMALVTPLLAFKYGTHTKWISWNEWYNLHVSRGRFLLFLGAGPGVSSPNPFNGTTEWNNTPFSKNLNFVDMSFAIFSYASLTCELLMIYLVDIGMNVMALTLWTATTFFVKTLKQQESCKNIIMMFETLKSLANEINCIIGTITLTYTVDSILYYATHLESLFTGGDWFSNLVVIEFFCSTVNWLHFASMACLQMDQFRDWIRNGENRSHLPSKSVSIMLLIDEISTNTVALSGNGLFTVNYKFMAQAVTSLMTYFIIVIQFNAK